MPTLTIDVTNPQGQRLQTAMGARLGLGRDATLQEIKQQTINFLINVVQEYEHRVAREAAAAAVTDISPT